MRIDDLPPELDTFKPRMVWGRFLIRKSRLVVVVNARRSLKCCQFVLPDKWDYCYIMYHHWYWCCLSNRMDNRFYDQSWTHHDLLIFTYFFPFIVFVLLPFYYYDFHVNSASFNFIHLLMRSQHRRQCGFVFDSKINKIEWWSTMTVNKFSQNKKSTHVGQHRRRLKSMLNVSAIKSIAMRPWRRWREGIFVLSSLKFLLDIVFLLFRCRLISSSCLQVCCGNRYKKASIRSLSAAQLREFQNFTLESSCEKPNSSNSYIIAKINDKLTDKTICAGVLVHRKFLITTAICVFEWVAQVVKLFGETKVDFPQQTSIWYIHKVCQWWEGCGKRHYRPSKLCQDCGYSARQYCEFQAIGKILLTQIYNCPFLFRHL